MSLWRGAVFAVTSFFSIIAVGVVAPNAAVAATVTVCSSGCDHTSIQAGINAASSGDTILVSSGTYSENINYGGKNVTVLSVNGAGVTTIQGSGGNSPVVNFSASETSSAILDGFTIDNQGASSATRGIYISGATPTIQNSIIQGNYANNGTDGGAGVYIINSAPFFNGVTIRANHAENRSGPGMYIKGAAGGATITNSTIGGANSADGNTTGINSGYGGGIYYTGSTSGVLTITGSNIQYNSLPSGGAGLYITGITNTVIISNTTILNNTAGSSAYGGGIYAINASLSITGGSISNNTSGVNRGGGGIYLYSAAATITGTTINANVTGSTGGGGILLAGTAPSVTLSKCYVQGNRTSGVGNGAGINVPVGTVTITNSIISGNSTGNNYWSSGGGLYVSGATANVYHTTFSGNWANRRGGGAYVRSGATATFNGALLWGNSAANANTSDIRDDATATINYSAVKSGSGYTGANNVTAITGTVFVTTASASYGNPTTAGDFHIKSDAVEIINTADPTSSVTDDIDGDSRTNNDMGADEIPPSTFQLDVTISGSAGTVTSSPGTINCTTGTCSESFNTGAVVTLTATPDAGYQFDGWTGAGCSGTGTCAVTMSAAKSVTATFSVLQYQLDVTLAGAGTGAVASSPGTINCTTGTCNELFDDATVVTLTATPDANQVFDGWSGAGCSGTGTCVVTMDAAKSVTATFSVTQRQLSVTMAGTAGTVASSPAGISCTTGTCNANFDHGASVTLTATPGTNQQFDGWTGTGCSGTGTCAVTMTSAQSVTATFSTLPQYALTTGVVGLGSLSSSPAGISCPGTCSANYYSATSVTLTPSPSVGQQFAGWSGACSGSGGCVVSMTSAKSVTATFTPVLYQLDVTISGSSGAVTSSPGTINCTAGICSESFSYGTTVTLTATPATGYQFDGWTGGGCSGTGTCDVAMNGAKSVTATFSGVPTQLSVTMTGTAGTVSSVPAGINCTTGTCNANFEYGTGVTLTATPGTNQQFDGWTGAGCSGTGTCAATMAGAQSVTATFSTLPLYQLGVTIAGDGSGSVTSSPGTINCTTGTCTESFYSGASVTLTATASAGSFIGWSGGGCSGTGTCVVTMTSAQSVTATFNNIPVLTVSVAGSGSITANTGPVNCPGTCVENFAGFGEIRTLTATPATGYQFDGWTGDCSGTLPCNLTMNISKTATATFSSSAAVPKTFTVTKTADTNDNACTPSDCSLREAIEAANDNAGATDTISVPAGTYYITLSGAENNNQSGDFNVKESVNIVGAGADQVFIVGDDSERVFNVSSSQTLSLTGISVSHGAGADGGCIYALFSTVSVTNSNFSNCVATSRGGAIYSTDMSISGSAFNNNTATGAGGALYSVNSFTITSSTFSSDTSGGAGGAACSGSGKITVDGAGNSFTNNTSGGDGGAIYAGADASVTGTTMTGNKTTGTGRGGAIYANGGTAVDVTNSTISNNTSAGAAGALGANGRPITITGSTFSNNTASGAGGAVYTNGTVTAVTSTFDGNSAPSSYGGAIYAGSSITFTGTTLSNNLSGGRGGGANSNGGTVTITNSTFSGNAATINGGGMYMAGATTITNSTFTGNTSNSYGGALQVNSGGLTITGSTISGNQSSSSGGGIYANTSITLTGSTVSGNTSNSYGGGIGSNGTLTASNSTISGNTAVGNSGGGFRGSGCTLKNVTFYGNSATSGGAYNIYGTCTVTNSIMANNGASNCSGGTRLSGGYNIEDQNTCNFVGTGDQVNINPLLNALSNNGGSTQTHSLQAGSPAIDKGDNTTCSASPISNVDQRGNARPLDGDLDATATCDVGAFEFAPYQLGVSVTGSGAVTSAPGTIDCPGTKCTEAFSLNDAVVLTATPTSGSGYVFTGWSGACSGTGTCSLTMNVGKNVTATFALSGTLHQLDVSVTGSGAVTSSPGSINCSSGTCSESFNQGMNVTLTATPSSGYQLSSWGGACAGTGACVVPMLSAKSVTATFSIIKYQLDVTVSSAGTITSSPGTISCSTGTCSESFDNNTAIALTGTPSPGYQFSGWTGDCSGTGTCNLTMDATKSVTAWFTTLRAGGTFAASEHGGVDVTYPDRAYYPNTDGVSGVSRAHIDAAYASVPRGECSHCHDWTSMPMLPWPQTFTDYSTKAGKVDFCGNCHTDADPDANGIDNDTPAGFSFQGPTKYKKSVHYTRNLQWPGGQYGTSYPAMDSTKQGTCVNCHSPHAHTYSSSYATIPDGWVPSNVPFPKQLVELTDIADSANTIALNWPAGWPNVNGRDPDDAEDLCYTCHDGDPVQNKDITTYNKYMKTGEATEPDLTSIKAAFEETYHHPVKDSEQKVIADTYGVTIPYKVECTTCHNPHLASGSWADFASGAGSPTPLTLPGVSPDWPPAAWGLNYAPGELWGDDEEEKLNALLKRIASFRTDARGTGGWQFNVDRGYAYEVVDNLPKDQPPVYQPPFGGPGPGVGYQPDGDALPDFLTFCLDCHQNVVGSKNPIYWGSYYPTAGARYYIPMQAEPHGFNLAGVSSFVCETTCDPSVPCKSILSSDLDPGNAFYNKPQGRGYETWILPPYSMEDRMAGINYVLSCTDCHEPHGSKRKSLLRDHINGNNIDAGGSLNVCTSCHWAFGGAMTNGAGSACGNGTIAGCSTTGCHGSVSLHRLSNNNNSTSTILRDPNGAW